MYQSGVLSIDGAEIALDDASRELCFVSHAHSDHTEAFRKKRQVIASEETFALAGKQLQFHSIPGVKLCRAGHMLGARQLSAEADGEKFAYTGDFSLHDSYTVPAAEIIQCDTLMIDSTYCLPVHSLPKREQVLSSMRSFVQKNEHAVILFGAYVRGKTQELVKFLNTECKIAPVVSAPAAKVCACYEKLGIKLDYISAGTDEAEEAMQSAFTAIMPPAMANFEFGAKLSEAFCRPVKTAVATGWAHVSKFPVDAAFPLSDHADFRDTMRYIYESGARKVICANSNSKVAASYLRTLGIDAVAKGAEGQAAVQQTLASR